MPFGGIEVDVLLADDRAVGDTARRRWPGSSGRVQSSMARSTRTPLLDQVQLADLADRDAAVGDLGVGEDAAGVGEVGVDGARRRCRTGSWSARRSSARHVGHADQRDDHEQDQLDLGRSPQHGAHHPPRRGASVSAMRRGRVRARRAVAELGVVPRCRRPASAARRAQRARSACSSAAQLVGEVQVDERVQVGVVALDELRGSSRAGTGTCRRSSAPRQVASRPRSAARAPASAPSAPSTSSVCVALMTRVATVPRFDRLVSSVTSFVRSSASTFSACGKVSSAVDEHLLVAGSASPPACRRCPARW